MKNFLKIAKKIWSILFYRLSSKIKYLIVDLDDSTNVLTFLCYGSRAFFREPLCKVVFDEKIITGLNPEQACFLGVKFGQLCKKDNFLYGDENYNKFVNRYKEKFLPNDDIAYDRSGNLIYFDKKTGSLRSEPIYTVASTEGLINQFESATAYFIGVSVGYNTQKMQEKAKICQMKVASKAVKLKLIKVSKN
jgi:hypothetical protein